MVHQRIVRILSLTLLLALASTVEAGPPLICVPFETGDAALLPWGQGQGWNTPDGRYDVRRLTRDTLQLLTAEAPVLARMENLRRATIYAAGDRRVADELLGAVLERARSGADAWSSPTSRWRTYIADRRRPSTATRWCDAPSDRRGARRWSLPRR
jgi:hypothetical protein